MSAREFFAPGTNGKGVMLIHGLTGAPAEMKYIAKKLNRAGYAVCGPLLAGHGQDTRALLKTTWRDWLESLATSADKLAAEVDSMSVAGICVGGALGLLLAAERGDVDAAAVYSMTFTYDGWNMGSWYSLGATVLQHVADWPGVRAISFAEPYPYGLKDERLREAAGKPGSNLIEGALDRLPMGSMYQMYRLGAHLERVGGSIRIPTLIVHARDDDMSAPRNAYRLRKALGGPTQVEILDDSYHMIHVDRERDQVAALTAAFFQAAPSVCADATPAAVHD